MSHSHLPVKHLLKQLENYRSMPRNWDFRPKWLTDLIGRVSELFDPAEDVARVGFECRLTEDAWEVWLFLGKSEIIPLELKRKSRRFIARSRDPIQSA